MFGSFRSRLIPVLLVLSLPIAAVSTWDVMHASAAGTNVFTETFGKSTVPDSHWVVGGTGFTPCLTASGNSSTTPITSCAGTSDTAGNGALRLTDAGNSESGYVFYNSPLPAAAGLDVSFDSFQYNGTGADGIAFFMTDGQFQLLAPGTSGGYLGYAGGTHPIGTGNGVAHGLFGVGLDAYGNFSNFENSPSHGGGNCADTYTPAFVPNSVVLRGPGDADKVNYCYLAGATAPSPLHLDSATTRTDGGANDVVRHVHVTVDPSSNLLPKVTVSINGTQVLQAAEPAMSPTVKFGWTSSTGGSTDIHELQNLVVSTVNPLNPSLSVANTINNGGVFLSGGATAGDATYTITNAVTANFEKQPFTLTVPVPAGLGLTSVTAVDRDMDCSATTSTQLSCTYTPTGYGFISGQSVAVDLHFSPLSTYSINSLTLTASVSSPDGGSPTTSQALQVNPVTIPAAVVTNANTPATVAQGAHGSAPFAWTAGTPANSALVASAIADTSGNLTVTPVPGASGTTTVPLSVTDLSGATSANANVPITVRPTVSAITASGTGPAPVTTNVPAPVGTGPFTYSLVTTPNAVTQGTAQFIAGSPEKVQFTPVQGFSGAVPTFTYRVTDAGGVQSTPASIDITVNKPAGPTAAPLTGTVDANTAFSQAVTTPTGAGPFTYAISTAPPAGTETISSAGLVTFTPPAGASGVYSSAYQVTDQYGQTSATGLIQVTVRPVAADFSGSTVGVAPLTITAPTPAGTGPFTWAATPPQTHGVLLMNAATGQVTFAPTAGYTGTFTFPYTVTDGSGTASTAKTVTITVNAPATPVAAAYNVTQDADTTVNDQLPAPTSGTGPFTYAVVTPPLSGSLVLQPGGHIVFTPAAGTSGVVTFTYSVTDPYGATSLPATATLNFRPVAPNLTHTTLSPKPVTIVAGPIDGTGPFVYALTQPPVAEGTATVDQLTGAITFTPASGYSGPAHFTYTVTGAGPTTSLPATVDITVAPDLAGVSATTPVNTPVTLTPATPTGSGPFTWAIATPPTTGTATIDPSTGSMTYTPAAGSSGTFTYTFVATDSHGTSSAPATATVHVIPAAAPASTTVPAGSGAVTMHLPTPTGTGPFTCALVAGSQPPASEGTATIDSATCTITFTPAAGFAGTVDVPYTVTDAQGQTSPPANFTFHILAAAVVVNPAPTLTGNQVPDTGSHLGQTLPVAGSMVIAGLLLLLLGLALTPWQRRRARARYLARLYRMV